MLFTAVPCLHETSLCSWHVLALGHQMPDASGLTHSHVRNVRVVQNKDSLHSMFETVMLHVKQDDIAL